MLLQVSTGPGRDGRGTWLCMVQRSKKGLQPRLVVTFAVFLILLLCGAVWVYVSQKNRLTAEAESNLGAIGRLKVSQIVQWRSEFLADGESLAGSPFVQRSIEGLLSGAETTESADLLATLRSFQSVHHYRDTLVVDARGNVAANVTGSFGQLDEEGTTAVSRSLQEGLPEASELSLDPGGVSAHIDAVSPVLNARKISIGGIVLVADAQDFLFPMIQSWPTSSRSAETLLVRRDGENVLFLNELRHRTGTALKLRIPMSRSDVPAVMAARGKTGLVRGVDYRGERVVAVVLGIPGSSWFIIAKEDEAEIFSSWRLASVLILAVFFALVAAAVSLFFTVWQRNEKSHYSAARAIEERHRVTLMSVGDGVIATDPHGVVTMINPSAESLTGWTLDEATGRPLEEIFPIVHEQSRQSVENPVRRVVREGRVVGLANHTLLIRRDGGELAVADSGAPIRGEDGNIKGVVLVFRDVSEERRAARALGDSEALYRSLFSNMLNGFAYCKMIYEDGKPRDFVYLEVNAAFENLTGLKDVTGKKVSEVIPGIIESDPELIETYGRVAGGGQSERFERYVRGLDDWYAVSVYCPRPEHFVAIFDVITERKKSDASRLLLSAAVEQTAEMIIITGADGTIQYVNPAFESVTGYSRAETIGRTPRILKSGVQDQEFYRELWETLKDGSTWKGHFENRKKDGTLYAEEATISPVFDDAGEIVNFVGAKHDTTRELSLEAQLRQAQKMESVGRLAGGVAHDYNNMLQVIGSYVEIILKDPVLTDGQKRNIEQIREAARRSAEITSQLLAFARKQAASPRVLDLNESVHRTMKMLHRLIGEQIELVWKPGVLKERVKIDPTQLDQVLANLSVNARDAIAGVGSLTLETDEVTLDAAYCERHPGYVPGRYVVLTVSDTGSGMTPEVQSHLFEPFFTTKPLGKGTGLGLATVYGIVKQNEGFINVYSEPGQGTSFRIYFPAVAAEAEHGARPNAGAEPDRGGTETILVVEDEETILQVSTLILEGLGYRVLGAGTPGEAARLAESNQGAIDLLITDVIMPKMNGKELSRRLSALYPGMKCLYMSGYTAEAISSRGLLEEGVHFLSKPFTTEQLAAKVRQVLDGKA